MRSEFKTIDVAGIEFDVCGIGNAIVDVLAQVDESFIISQQMHKGGMQLIDTVRAEYLYDSMSGCTVCSGGSVANTMAGLASLGARVAYMGRVHDDQLGQMFRHDMRSCGVAFDTRAAQQGKPTARCLICVTPDAERTMNTYIGACAELDPSDIDEERIKASGIIYIEGYLWDQPAAKDAIRHAIQTAKIAGRKVALSLSDLFCVERHREEFNQIIHEYVDVLFANESELLALAQLSDVKQAAKLIGARVRVLVVTQGAQGVLVVSDGVTAHYHADVIDEVVDTTGAGDLFAAGFLFGLTQGESLADCADIGNCCAGVIIQQMGARASQPLAALVA
jgi:sugar/nucleoside kinase (ribokinase family)